MFFSVFNPNFDVFRITLLSITLIFTINLIAAWDILTNRIEEDMPPHNVYFGKLEKNDQLLHSWSLVKHGVEHEFVSEEVTYPDNGLPGNFTIHYIEILDQWSNDAGGWAFIKNGGVGKNSVTISINSQPSFGYSFKIHIYGS